MYPAVIFDVDGVLIESKDSVGEFLWQKNLQNDLGIESKTVQLFFTTHLDSIIDGTSDTVAAIAEFFRENSISLPPQKFLSYWLSKDSNLNYEMLEIVRWLVTKKIPRYLGTNQESNRARYLWENLRFSEIFTEKFVSSALGVAKPNQYFFSKIQDRLALRSDQIIFIDDSIQNVEAAAALGWQTIHHRDVGRTKLALEYFI